jgi:hypothetical protein
MGADGSICTTVKRLTVVQRAYEYDVMGNLRSVDTPSGQHIEYLVDGRNRRIAKKVDDIVVRQWLYEDSLNPIAELDGSGTFLYRYVYASMAHSPDFLVTPAGTIYRVLRDQLGSPLLVVNTLNRSDVLLNAKYSTFGRRTLLGGIDPALSLGFAGGIYDDDTGLTRLGARDYDPVIGHGRPRIQRAGMAVNRICTPTPSTTQ